MRTRLLALLWLLALAGTAWGQQPVGLARQTSYYTYVFRLNEAQTRRLFERGLRAARPDYFTMPVDSFPTDSLASYRQQGRPLGGGYHLLAYSEGPELVYWLHAETGRRLEVLDNHSDLALVLRDSLGQLVPDAQLRLRHRRLPYDPATRAYRSHSARRAGLVAVTWQGRTTFQPLELADARSWRPNSWVKRVGQRVLYGWPLGYLTGPVRRTVGELHHASDVTTGPIGLLRSAFSEDVRDERHERRDSPYQQRRYNRHWRGYVLLSQPRYRPGTDTLRLKARVLRRGSGRPCTRPLALWLTLPDGPPKRLALLRPLRPGTYEYTLPLADSLGLRPDTDYPVYLGRTPHEHLVESDFRLEDYELKNNQFTLRLLTEHSRRGEAQAVFVRGRDANELNLLDARVELTVLPTTVPERLPGRVLFVPDTLWTHTQPLDPLGETRIELPDRIFPAADLDYRVVATLLTTDNEARQESRNASWQTSPGRLTLTLHGDSVRLRYDSLGYSRPHRARLRVLRAGATRPPEAQPVQLPLDLPLDPEATEYELRDAAGHTARLRPADTEANLTLRAPRTADSLQLAVDNPRQLPFWYFVYRGQQLRYQGYGPRLDLRLRETAPVTWHVSLHYRWGGALRAQEFTSGPPRRDLLITTTQPPVGYPGQRLHLGFRATTADGRPVPDADLTAYAFTSRFGVADLPPLPAFGPPTRQRLARRGFRLPDALPLGYQDKKDQPLDWPRWQRRLGLDSLQLYRFLYPETGLFVEYRPAPGGQTQLAPYVVEAGQVRQPMLLYLDDQPVYVGGLNDQQPYAVVAAPGRHTLRIRLARQVVTVRDLDLQPGQKLTLSLDLHHPRPDVLVTKAPLRLSAAERLTLQRTVLGVQLTGEAARNGEPLVLQQGRVLRWLPGYGSLRLAGPFRPDSVRLLRAGLPPASFLFEPLFTNTFGAGTLQQKPLPGYEPGNLTYARPVRLSPPYDLNDFALTPADVQAAFVRGRPTRYFSLPEPPITPTASGRLVLRMPTDPTAAPLPPPVFMLLTRPDQPTFSRLGRGLGPLAGLVPGRYRVAVLLADSTRLQPTATVLVQANGATFVQLSRADQLPNQGLAARIRLLLADLTRQATDAATARNDYSLRPLELHPGWLIVSGRVTDSRNEGLPGVTVLAWGNSSVGTSTSADGDFSLQVPPNTRLLFFAFVGYTTKQVAVGSNTFFTVKLEENAEQLSEAVVVGYGTTSNYRFATGQEGYIGELQGKVSGVQIQSSPDMRVMIRGASSVAANGDGPLYIVNGLPFAGDLSQIPPEDIVATRTLSGAAATGLYGARGANGVVLLTVRKGAALPAGAGASPDGDPRLSLRHRFADHAWWRPTLLTDAQGQAFADVVLPDDVTAWNTFVAGSDAHGHVGGTVGQLRSFKALRAELAGPRFLVAGDRVQVLGKVLNYQGDTATVTTRFQQGERVLRQQTARVATALLDTLTVTAPPTTGAGTDSLALTFGFSRPDGYADGEQRRLPVLPAGTREAVGSCVALLAADTTLQLPLDPRLGPATVHIEGAALPLLEREIDHLERYPYGCNEQLASRLQGLLLARQVRAAQGRKFGQAGTVQQLIRRLLAGRRPDGLWGTWPSSAASMWATLHAVEALQAANQAGFSVSFGQTQLIAQLLAMLDADLREPVPASVFDKGDFLARTGDQLRLLALLRALKAEADYPTYLQRFEQRLAQPRLRLDHYLALTELRQQLGLPYQLDSLRRYRQRTALGGAYYADTTQHATYYRYLLPDQVGTTLLAYRVLRAQGGHDAELARIRAYLLGLRGGGYWGSTYLAAQALATIGPDMLAAEQAAGSARVELSGAAGLPAGPLPALPFTQTLPAAGPLTLHKTGPLPVYATAYQLRRVADPAAAALPFRVATTLAGQAGRQVALPAGRPAELLVTVDVQDAARYVLLEVPVPAGCSYADPVAATNPLEQHREYLKQQVGIFIDELPVGRHTFRVALQPRYRGRYTLNPARAELLYFPTRFGRTAGKQVRIF